MGGYSMGGRFFARIRFVIFTIVITTHASFAFAVNWTFQQILFLITLVSAGIHA